MSGRPSAHSIMNETEYRAFLNFEWKLFDGFERNNALREARLLARAAEADLAALELKAIREVWKAYSDVKTALRKHEYALALLAGFPGGVRVDLGVVSLGGAGDRDRSVGGPTRPGPRQDHRHPDPR